MATLATEVLTYADLAKRMDANGRIDTIIEMLMQWNEILDDMLVRECNNGTAHKTTVRTGLPEATWRLLNYGVPRGKSHTAQVQDTCGMLEVYAEADKALIDMNGGSAARLSEAKAFIQGMNNQMAETLFYGNVAVNPERFHGLTPRYNSLSGAASSENVIDADGDTALGQTSIWLVTWGEETTHGLYPQGSKAGLSHRDLGEQTLSDGDGGQYQGYRDHFKWDLGLTVRDWRFNVRIANVEVADLDDVTYIKSLLSLMIEAEERLPTLSNGRHAWYVNRPVRTALRNAVLEKVSNQLTFETVAGKRVTMFDGIPVRRVDVLKSTEAVVT